MATSTASKGRFLLISGYQTIRSFENKKEMLSQRTQTNNLFRNAVTMDSVPAQDVLQLLGQTEPEIVLLQTKVTQQLIHTVHATLKVVAHFHEL